ncbi:hypothetical protein OIU93_18560 [Paeniglutamicibacter sp. ZC-3]|uniref:hypothetical protein n=1 Tax=Paeniglutamicibacter sp. ZC-3 TaxID=2986919 RepID=UPI0021F791F1|nr:hypothetical protein [Paeniglutamicibacter sp. ZC-3]MCV9996279.1 hypothetical protein [Paeniglutamicibacter sp. ZC-3]
MANQPESAGHLVPWERFLADLEDQVAQLRESCADDASLLELPHASWSPPAGMGELPPELGPRARAILAEMDSLTPVLGERRDEAARQLRAVSSVPRDSAVTSVYLDSVG